MIQMSQDLHAGQQHAAGVVYHTQLTFYQDRAEQKLPAPQTPLADS